LHLFSGKDKPAIKHICFDLDGTLIDSFQTIYKATLKAMKHLDISADLPEKGLYNRIGHHFIDIFNELKIPVPDVEHFISVYKNFYFDFIDESEVYPGIEDVLKQMQNNKILISLLTTKIQEQAEAILNHFNLSKYFDVIMGRRNHIPVKPSPIPLLKICSELNVEPGESLMTGDTELDINCGKNAGTMTCAVLYGYREKELLIKEKPDYVIENAAELNLLLPTLK
jgi:phosphoglycolate phosphatase-like HAD superfamily hydrolase